MIWLVGKPQAIPVSHARLCTCRLEMDTYPERSYLTSVIPSDLALDIRNLSREYYDLEAAKAARTFGHAVSSNFRRIQIYISFIRKYDEQVDSIRKDMHELVDANEETEFVKQIHLIESYKGAGFLSAVSLMGEIGDFKSFKSPKQLFAYFGLDPAVKDSGKFKGTKSQHVKTRFQDCETCSPHNGSYQYQSESCIKSAILYLLFFGMKRGSSSLPRKNIK